MRKSPMTLRNGKIVGEKNDSIVHESTLTLQDLPNELLHDIIDLLDYEDVLALSRTSSSLRRYCLLPLKHWKADLRVIDGRLPRPDKEPLTEVDVSTESFRYIHWPPRFDSKALAKQQHTFTSMILDHSDTAAAGRVRELHWTIGNRCSKIPYAEPAVGDEERLWELFGKMRNVRKLDLECYHESWGWDYLRSPPPKLFPQASNIRLSGVMYRQIIMAVLAPACMARLEHLTLDNLQDPGMWRGKEPFDWVEARMVQEDVNNDTDTKRCPGPVRGILPLLTGQCPNLKSFRYRKAGKTIPSSRRGVDNDERVYIEIADFVRSVSQTLEVFTLEHGLPEHTGALYRRGELQKSSRTFIGHKLPMDDRLERRIWPVLQDVEWPALRKVRLTIGTWQGKRGISFGKINALRKHLGRQMELQVVEIDDRPCDVFRGG